MKNKKVFKKKKDNPRKSDLNYLIIKDRYGKAILRKYVYSHVILTFLMIAVQILIFIFFLLKLKPYIEIYLGASIVMSTAFMIYLSNIKGKNEFKIAWIVPLTIFPLFGVGAYIMYHINYGGLSVGKKLNKLKEETHSVLKTVAGNEPLNQKLSAYPDFIDLAHYLMHQGCYYPHLHNKLEYFSCGESFYPELFNSLKNAKKFIFIEFFIIDVDESWVFLLEVLEQKVLEGVEVRVMYDGLGSVMASSKRYQQYLQNKGIKTHIFLPLMPVFATQQNNRDHRKIVVIDGQVAYTGGLNISNQYFNYSKNKFKYWKDNAVKIQGAAIKNLTTMFLQTWNIQEKEPDDYSRYIDIPYEKYEEKGVVIPYGDDAYNNADIAEDVYLYILGKAKKYVHITTPYFIVDNQMMESLLFAHQRGIEVSLIITSVPDHYLTFCIGKTFLKTLVENGINVYLYQKGFIHSKCFISDDMIATVGSVNLDYRSLYHHFECGTVIYDCEVIKSIENDFQETLKDCVQMKVEDYKKLPLSIRFFGRVFRIFSPLM